TLWQVLAGPSRSAGRAHGSSAGRAPGRGRPSERDVVVPRGARGRRCRGEVLGVDRDVGPRGEAVARAAGVVTAAQELDGVGDDVDRLTLGALGRLPLAPFQAPVDGHGPPLGQEPGAVLAL